MKKKFIPVLSVAVCAAVAVGACGSREDTNVFTGDTTEDLPYQANLNSISPSAYGETDGLDLEPGTYISVIGKEDSTAYWQQVKAGVEQAAADLNEALGYTGGDRVKVLFNAPAGGEDIDEQVNILDEELARYPDVIAIASIDEGASAVQFDLATENGIPIVAFDSGNSYQGIQCTCRTDNVSASAEAAERLCEALGGSGEIMLLVHDSVSENGKEREAGFREKVQEQYPGVTAGESLYMDQLDGLKREAAAEQLGVTLPAEEEAGEPQTADNDTADAAAEGENPEEEGMQEVAALAETMTDEDALAYYLEKHPDVKGCFATNAISTQLAVSALKAAGKTDTVTLMGFDAGKDQIASLENGEIEGLIVQNPFGIGYAAVVASARTVLEIGNEAQVDTGYIWVDQDNMGDESIRSMLYE